MPIETERASKQHVPGAPSRQPALFLDRDGVINEEIGYLHRFEDVRFVPGIVVLLQAAHRAGIFTCVVTNQAGIGRGFYTEDQFAGLMRAMRHALEQQGGCLDAIYHSPYHPVEGIGVYRRDSDCRKPGPGMLLRAAEEHALDLSRSLLVGDRCSDIAAGHAAGVTELYLLGELEQAGCPTLPHTRIRSLAEVTAAIERRTHRHSDPVAAPHEPALRPLG